MSVPAGPELRDIHLPPPPGWWPPAPGWWMLAALVLIAIGIGVALWRSRARRHRYVDVVLLELDTLAARHTVDGDRSALAAGISQLLRRVARQHDPDAVHLRGAAWLALLQSLAPKDEVSALASLDEAIYRRDTPVDAVAAVTAARSWLRTALLAKRGGTRAPIDRAATKEDTAHA
jgi:Domain of unknown function (DUF4381)